MGTVSEPALSVVIPAFNEAERLPGTLAKVMAYLRERGESFEIVVVDDGSADATAEQARRCGRDAVRVLQNQGNRGKGYSVRRGMLAARGARRLMTDADLSTPIGELEKLEAALRDGHDVAIGSRAVRGARIEVRQPWYRENLGRVFNLLVQLAVLPGLKDTQCGFKLFTAAAAAQAFGRSRLDGFAFDVEVLYLARRAGRRIIEIPVVWRNDAATRVGSFKGFLAFVDVLRIRGNALLGRYPRPVRDSAGSRPTPAAP
jgi:dolichyl-phosphate beta-glucosyltransferase